MSIWVHDYRSLIDFFSVVVVCSPDRFFKEDYLKDDQQLTLDSAFDHLRRGLHFATDRIADKAIVGRIYEGLEAALASYRSGQALEGSRVLQEVEKLVLSNTRHVRRD